MKESEKCNNEYFNKNSRSEIFFQTILRPLIDIGMKIIENKSKSIFSKKLST